MKGSKNPKRSAREKFNRRKLWAAATLEQLKFAVEDVLSQPGRVVGKAELLTIKAAIEEFVQKTGRSGPINQYLTEEQADAVNLVVEGFITANSTPTT